MTKTMALGLAVALSLGLTLPAAAENTAGTVQSIDKADKSFVLQDGTRLSVVSDRHLDMVPGDFVLATYETQDGKNVVTRVERRLSEGNFIWVWDGFEEIEAE